MSTVLTPCLSTSFNGFQCALHRLDPKFESFRTTSCTRKHVDRKSLYGIAMRPTEVEPVVSWFRTSQGRGTCYRS